MKKKEKGATIMVISIDSNNKVIGYAFLDDLVCHTEKGILSVKTSILREIPDMDKHTEEYKYFSEHFNEYIYIPAEKTVRKGV